MDATKLLTISAYKVWKEKYRTGRPSSTQICLMRLCMKVVFPILEKPDTTMRSPLWNPPVNVSNISHPVEAMPLPLIGSSEASLETGSLLNKLVSFVLLMMIL